MRGQLLGRYALSSGRLAGRTDRRASGRVGLGPPRSEDQLSQLQDGGVVVAVVSGFAHHLETEPMVEGEIAWQNDPHPDHYPGTTLLCRESFRPERLGWVLEAVGCTGVLQDVCLCSVLPE